LLAALAAVVGVGNSRPAANHAAIRPRSTHHACAHTQWPREGASVLVNCTRAHFEYM
jgi:hypothetical protein